MMAAVPQASVIITNPTHYAIALRYEQGETPAPICLAKGVDAVAQRIREVAQEHNIPIVENPPLARALFATADLDQPIPREHYEAVAKVIGFVMRAARRRGRPRRTNSVMSESMADGLQSGLRAPHPELGSKGSGMTDGADTPPRSGGRLDPMQIAFWAAVALGVAAAGVAITVGAVDWASRRDPAAACRRDRHGAVSVDVARRRQALRCHSRNAALSRRRRSRRGAWISR